MQTEVVSVLAAVAELIKERNGNYVHYFHLVYHLAHHRTVLLFRVLHFALNQLLR